METVEQMDERRARAIFEWGVDFPKWEEHKFQQSGFYLKSLQQAKDVRASDASAGLVAVPVELLIRARDVSPYHLSIREDIDAILRAAQGENADG